MIVEDPPAARERRERRFTTDEFHRIIEAGVLGADERVELIDGHIMLMLPVGDPHIACVDRLTYLFTRQLYAQKQPPAYVSVQNPVRLSEEDEPRPDVMLIHPDVHAEARAANADEVFLVVEVAASSLAYDREPKLRRYALHGIPEVWVVALERARIYVYREPAGDEYRTLHTRGPADTLGVEALPTLDALAVDEIPEPAST